MLHLRSFVPPSSPCAQWQFRVVLRLPPELREVTLRSFCTTAPASHPIHTRDDPPFDEEDDSADFPEASGGARLDDRVTRRPGELRKQQYERPGLPGQLSGKRRLDLMGVESTRRAVFGENLRLKTQRKSRLNESRNWNNEVPAGEVTLRQRLAQLKRTIRESPDHVANGPAIQQQLQDVEGALQGSHLRAQANSGLPQNQGLGRRENMTGRVPESEGLIQWMPASSTADAAVTNPQSTSSVLAPRTSFTGNTRLAANPRDLSIAEGLRLQLQDLTNVLKVFVSQQAQAGKHYALPSTDALSRAVENLGGLVGNSDSRTARYQTMQKSSDGHAKPVPFASLPHEIQLEDLKVLDRPLGALSGSHLPTDPTTSLDDSGSLYDQLFPGEASQALPPTAASEPILPVPLPTDANLLQVERVPVSRSEELAQDYNSRDMHIKSVLILRSASKTLTEDDFRRAMPRGKHLKEWSQRGEYERVIPVRDFWTLDRTGDYYIVFRNRGPAELFLEHVKKVYKLAKEYTSSSLLSSLRPASRSLSADSEEGEDEAEMVRNFTLIAPSMPLSLEYSPGIRKDVLMNGGYPQALPGGLTVETPQVLLTLHDGNMPNWFEIRDAIAQDGNRRGIAWNLLPGELAIRRLEMERPKGDVLRAHKEIEDDDGGESTEWVPFSDAGDDEFSMLAQERLTPGHNGQRWALAFKERPDAQRFVRLWHMRGFPWTEEDKKTDLAFKGSTRVKAELLW